jgi:glycosyltransferase involved in cell wall biosynthesis
MKVLHVCWDLGQGGIQRYLVDLLRAHQGQLESKVLVLSSPGALSEEASALSEDVVYLGMKNGLSLAAIVPILRILRSGDHDVIHSHANNIVFNLALCFQSRPVLYTEHGGRFLNKEFASLVLYGLLSSNIDRYIAISHFMAELMAARTPGIRDRIQVVHNGISSDKAASTGSHEAGSVTRHELPGGQKVGFVGRLVIDKGIDLFIETAIRVHQVNTEANFIIVGDGPALEEMQDLVREHNLEHRFFFLGYRKDAREIIGELDILLFTSRYDGFGLVIVEALASGVPVVAMDHRSAVGEIVRAGIDGLIVDGLNVDAAAECVVRLLEAPALRDEMSSAARVRAGEFTIENNALQLAREYRKCITSNTRRDSGNG